MHSVLGNTVGWIKCAKQGQGLEMCVCVFFLTKHKQCPSNLQAVHFLVQNIC